ncbi:MAG TPA: DUF1501 domain-containing protein [Pirellulales bacterium]|jgi:hypothetical protein|nr:DUF1501 domain-containing protein [Pirellulales bacterium]
MHLTHEIGVHLNRERVISRRDWLRTISAGAVAAGTLSFTDLLSVHAGDLRKQGKSVILLWMQGGPSQFETFSPKPGHANGGETKAISTAVSGIEIAESYPNLAKQMQDVAIIRSMTSKEGSHPRATFLLHTGYLPTATVKFPSLGAIAAHELAEKACELPSFVRIGGRSGTGGGGGFYGSEFDPFVVAQAGSMPTNVQPTTGTDRYRRRLDLLSRLESDYARTAPQEVADHQKLYSKASKMILSSQMKTFDLSTETDLMREAYGKTPFGLGCLLARRLVESGVTCVEVNLGNWDTHDDNFNRTKTLAGQLDQPFARLIADLKQRGLLDSTLIVWMGEFGRTPNINARGGRDHFPRAFNVALAGGGIKGGQVIGDTDKGGTEVAHRPVTVADLFQTFCKGLQINPAKETMSTVGRPIKIVDGGKPVQELFG